MLPQRCCANPRCAVEFTPNHHCQKYCTIPCGDKYAHKERRRLHPYTTQRAKAKEYEKNKEYIKARQKEYRLKNKASVRESQRQWRAKQGREALNKTRRDWCDGNPVKVAAIHARRRARKENPDNPHLPKVTESIWLSIIKSYGGKCAYCGCAPECLTRDHIIPLSKGGADTPSNVAPACRSCNSKKRDLTVVEFMLELRSA